jgi:hypothetical protein
VIPSGERRNAKTWLGVEPTSEKAGQVATAFAKVLECNTGPELANEAARVTFSLAQSLCCCWVACIEERREG